MVASQDEVQSITASWPSPIYAEQRVAAALMPSVEASVAQFQALVRDDAGLRETAAKLTRAANSELVSVISSPPPPFAGGVAPEPPPGVGRPDVRRVTAAAERAGPAFSSARYVRSIEPKRALRRTAIRSSVEPAANPTPSDSLPSGTGSAVGGGISGLAAPAAALLVVAAACLLATRLLGRRNTDSLLWRSTLLSLRLERPG
jgi:hypothetical protein